MTATAVIGARILASEGWCHDHALLVEAGEVTGIVAKDHVPVGATRHVLQGGILLPGFIDTQVNGGGGILFNDVPTVEGVAAIAAAHRRYGTTAIMPTIISDTMDVVAAAIAAVDSAILAGVPGVVGIHIEGPFLNVGKRGIHDASKLRKIDAAAIDLLSYLATRTGTTGHRCRTGHARRHCRSGAHAGDLCADGSSDWRRAVGHHPFV